MSSLLPKSLPIHPRELRYALQNRLNPMQFSHIIDIRACRLPDYPVLTFESNDNADTIVTYQALHENGHRFAAALLKMGIDRGDCFAVMMYNHPEMVYLISAANIIGAIMVPIDPRSRGHKLAHQIADSKSKAIFITANLIHTLDEIGDFLPKNLRRYAIQKPGKQVSGELSNYGSIQEILDQAYHAVTYRTTGLKAPLQIIYTSGTTGNPKGVVNENARFGMMGYLLPKLWHYKNDDVLYTGLSFSHGNGQGCTLAPAIYGARKAVLSERFTKTRLWDIARKYNVTCFSKVGGVAAGIFNEPAKQNDADNPGKRVISAGMPQAIWEKFEKRFGVDIVEWYSTLEGGGFAVKPPGQGPVGSFGKPPAFIRMKVVDENDKACPPNQPGEVIARPLISKAVVNYFGNPKASKAKTRGGWNRTGDIAHIDENGWWYFDYRAGSELRRNGDFIQPEQIESVIGEHPDVSEVSVFGIPSAGGSPGESDLVAGIVLFDGIAQDPQSIYTKLCHSLEANSVPSYLLFLDEIPMTISQKPQGRFLKQQFEDRPEQVYAFSDMREKRAVFPESTMVT